MPGILRDKTIDDKSLNIPNDIDKSTPYCGLKLMNKKFQNRKFESTNLYLMKVL